MAAVSGATTRELMHRMGHSSSRAALIYQHATEDRDLAIAEAMSRLVRPTPLPTPSQQVKTSVAIRHGARQRRLSAKSTRCKCVWPS
jgi:hypothetical protein